MSSGRSFADAGHVELTRATDSTDAGLVAEVLVAAFSAFRRQYTPAAFSATAPSAEHIADRMSEGPVWLATSGAEPLGTGSAVVTRDQCYVRGMAVVPAARGRGIGTLILREIEEFARALDLARLTLHTTPFLEDATRLYRRLGFVAEGAADLHGTPLIGMAKVLW